MALPKTAGWQYIICPWPQPTRLLAFKNRERQTVGIFLGLSFSHYYFNRVQKHPIIKGDYLQIEGSLVKIVKVTGLPGYDDYSAIEDGKLFKIKLKDLMQDSDQDGYNDIFEKSFGLNPNNKDTDGDGIDDFNDMNPMYKSEKNKFSQLYEQIIQTNSGILNSTKQNYSFSIYNNDCDYFHQINPNFRVLFIPENKKEELITPELQT